MITTKPYEFQLRNQLKMISSTSSKHPHPHPILKEKTFFFWPFSGKNRASPSPIDFPPKIASRVPNPFSLTFHRSHPPFGAGLEIGLDRWCEVHSTPPWPWLLPSLSWSQAPFWRRWFLVEKLFFVSHGIFFPWVFLADFFFHREKWRFFFGFLLVAFESPGFFGGEAALGCFFCFFCSCCWYL